MPKSYSFPTAGPVKSKLRFDWGKLPHRILDWFKESRRGVVLGAGVGLFVAVVYSLFVSVQAVARRSVWFPAVELTLWQIIAGYLAAFVVAGALVGAFAPVLRWRVAAVVAGMLAGIVVYGLTGAALYGSVLAALRGSVQIGLGMGGPVGYYLHYELVPERRWSQSREALSIIALGVVLVVIELLLG